MPDAQLRPARPEDRADLADLWHAGWHEAHASIVPAALTAERTHASFWTRLAHHIPKITVATLNGQIAGFVEVQGTELYQLYTAPNARGTGLAATLVQAAEQQLEQHGITQAHLLCAVGNERAARFYRKMGWHNAGTVVDSVELVDGRFPLNVWRFEKAIGPQS